MVCLQGQGLAGFNNQKVLKKDVIISKIHNMFLSNEIVYFNPYCCHLAF